MVGVFTAMKKNADLWTSKYWHDQAEEAWMKAAEMRDANAKATMERIAATYRGLSERQTSN
jgi:hypothetical protein